MAVLAVDGGEGELAGGCRGGEGLVSAAHAADPGRGAGLISDEPHTVAKDVGEGDGLLAAVEGLAELGTCGLVGPEVDAPVNAAGGAVRVGPPFGERPLALLRTHDAGAGRERDGGDDAVDAHGHGVTVSGLSRGEESMTRAAEVREPALLQCRDGVVERAGDVPAGQGAGPDLGRSAVHGYGERFGLAVAQGGEVVTQADGEGLARLGVAGPGEAQAGGGPEGQAAVDGLAGAVDLGQAEVGDGDVRPVGVTLGGGGTDRQEGKGQGDDECCGDCFQGRISWCAHVYEHKSGPAPVSKRRARFIVWWLSL